MNRLAALILYGTFSVIWLFFSIFFVSDRYLIDDTEFNHFEYEAAVKLFPYGLIMLVIWFISLIAFVCFFKHRRALTNYKNTGIKDTDEQ